MFDLSSVKETTNNVLPAGKYTTNCLAAMLLDSKSGGKYIQCEFVVANGDHKGRKIFHNFNVENNNAKAVEIGLSQLKSFLKHSGYENPDQLDSVEDLEGRQVEIKTKVKQSEQWGDKAEISAFLPKAQVNLSDEFSL